MSQKSLMDHTLGQYSLKIENPCNIVAWRSYEIPIAIQLQLFIGFVQCVYTLVYPLWKNHLND